jgi:hypothetical protein
VGGCSPPLVADPAVAAVASKTLTDSWAALESSFRSLFASDVLVVLSTMPRLAPRDDAAAAAAAAAAVVVVVVAASGRA